MASAEQKKITRVDVVLTLSEDESRYLHSLLRSVGGLGTLRDLNTAISDALYRADVPSRGDSVFKEAEGRVGYPHSVQLKES